MSAWRARSLALALFLVACSPLLVADVAVPALTGHVMDEAGLLTAAGKASLEQTLQALEARKGSQLIVLTVPTTSPESIEQYALRVAERWKPGRARVDDGAIVLIARDDAAMRIEVGYGLEGALNDATAKRIIAETMTPYFRQGDYNGGIAAGVAQLVAVIDGEPLPPSASKAPGGLDPHALPILAMLALAAGGVLRTTLGRLHGAAVTGGIVALVAWFFAGVLSIALLSGVVALLFTLFGDSVGGRGLGHAVGGFGRSGRGGFSGGGGNFGGGGATGRW